MKKHSLISFLGMTACLFISCNNYLGRGNHIDIGGGFPEGGCICFFQFTDTSYMNNILIAPENGNGYEYMLHYGKILDGGEWWLPLFPKNLEGQPIFGESTHGGTNIDFYYLDGTFYTVEDVVENPKYIALKGDYYICYPFTALESRGRYINAEWKDFYTIDFRNVKIIPSNHVFKIRYNISELVLANLTQKSTKHFPRKNAEMITIDDVVETINRLIETNKIDDYCYQLYHY
jgi:hypothetical protein